MDGICPYVGEDEAGELKLPDEETLRNFFNQKATQIKWPDSDERFYGGRPWEFMFEAIYAMEKIAKMMSFLVEAGFTPDGLAFLKPMAGGAITNEQRAEFRQHVSQSVRRLMKGAIFQKWKTMCTSGMHQMA